MDKLVSLVVKDVHLGSDFNSSVEGHTNGRWFINTNCHVVAGGDIILATGENHIRDVELSFHELGRDLEEHLSLKEKFYRSDDAVAKKRIGGLANYDPGRRPDEFDSGTSAMISFDVHIPPELMKSLVHLLEIGRFPKRFCFELEGLELQSNPHISYVWKNEDETDKPPALFIYLIHFLVPMRDSSTEALVDLTVMLKQALKWLKGAVVLLAIVAAAVVIANYR